MRHALEKQSHFAKVAWVLVIAASIGTLYLVLLLHEDLQALGSEKNATEHALQSDLRHADIPE